MVVDDELTIELLDVVEEATVVVVVLDVVVVELVVDDVLEEVEQDVATGARLQV